MPGELLRASKIMLLAVCAVFAPIKASLIALLVLVILDLVLGIMASRKRGEPITSMGLKKTIGKVFIYELSIMIAFVTQRYLTGEIIPIEKIVAAFIGLTELTSVMENLNEVSGGELLKALVNKISNSAKDSLKE